MRAGSQATGAFAWACGLASDGHISLEWLERVRRSVAGSVQPTTDGADPRMTHTQPDRHRLDRAPPEVHRSHRPLDQRAAQLALRQVHLRPGPRDAQDRLDRLVWTGRARRLRRPGRQVAVGSGCDGWTGLAWRSAERVNGSWRRCGSERRSRSGSGSGCGGRKRRKGARQGQQHEHHALDQRGRADRVYEAHQLGA